jgi:hypothetical protein
VLLAIILSTSAVAVTDCSIIRSQPGPSTLTGTLQGVVTGPNGPVANAEIAITAADATQHIGVSNSNGYYLISGIPIGQATFSVKAAGFAEYDGNIVIASDPTTNKQDVSLNPQ